MERFAEKAADFLVPDEAAPPPATEPPVPTEEPPAAVPAASKKRPAAAAPAASKKRPAAVVKPQPKKVVKVKTEAERELPFRSSGRRHKAGFYNEANLASLAWRGTGSVQDPIRFD